MGRQYQKGLTFTRPDLWPGSPSSHKLAALWYAQTVAVELPPPPEIAQSTSRPRHQQQAPVSEAVVQAQRFVPGPRKRPTKRQRPQATRPRGLHAAFWRDLPRSHWMLSCWTGYLLGLLGTMVYGTWWWSGAQGVWPLLIAFGATFAVILLLLGRSIAFLVAAIVAACALAAIWPDVSAAEAYLANSHVGPPGSPLWTVQPGFALPAVITSATILVLAIPYATLHVWRSLRG